VIAASAPNTNHSSLPDAPVNARSLPVPPGAVEGAAPADTDGLPLPGVVRLGLAVVVVAAALTTTVPVMFECTLQWYANRPACAKTCEYDAPGSMHGPVGQPGLESNAPVSDVTLWITEPVFVQVTVLPAATVTVAGEKPKSTIDTVAVAAAPGGATVTGANGSLSGVVGADVVVGASVVVGRAGEVVGADEVGGAGVAAKAGAAATSTASAAPATRVSLRRLLIVPLSSSTLGIRRAGGVRSIGMVKQPSSIQWAFPLK
jgi:hypothetical protein